MPVLALDHVQLTMPAGGEGRARAFYADVLGLAEVEKPAPLRAMGGVWFRAGETELHLGVERDFRPARRAHPALLVDSIDVLAADCASAGFDVQWDDRYPRFRRFYVHDPFGNRIEILQPR